VILTIGGISETSVPFGDVITNEGIIPPDTIDIILENDPRNPEGLASLTYSDIVLEAITVTLTRVDGGFDTPGTNRYPVVFRVPAQGTLTIEGFEIVPATEKAKFPISDLIYYGYERSTNYSSIRMEAFVEVTGHTIGGGRVYASGSIYIEFTNFAD